VATWVGWDNENVQWVRGTLEKASTTLGPKLVGGKTYLSERARHATENSEYSSFGGEAATRWKKSAIRVAVELGTDGIPGGKRVQLLESQNRFWEKVL